MTNPFDLTYLTTASPLFGPLAWIFFAIQVLGLAAGVYLRFFRSERDALQRALVEQLGLALLVVGGIGTLLGLLRLGDVGIFSQRYWFYFLLLVELGLAGYIAYYLRVVYPAQRARARTTRTRPAASRSPAPRPLQNGVGASEPERPVATTGRRSARRERKRKQR